MQTRIAIAALALAAFAANGAFAAQSLTPGIYEAADLTAEPEEVTLISVGTDDFQEDTYRQEREETFSLEVYELAPGMYTFVNDPLAKEDPVFLKNDIGGFNLSNVIADSEADGVLIRGTGAYPGETAIGFGLLREYPELPTLDDGSIDLERAAGEVGYQLYTGRRYINVDGVIAAFENVSIGDHANNNVGVVHTFGGGRTFMNDVWIYNVYDGVFFDDAGDGYFNNCVFHQTYQAWNSMEDANAAGYFTEEWNALVQPEGLGGTPYAEGVAISEEDYPETIGVVLGNNTASGFNINLFETEGADPQNLYFKNCTLIKHQVRQSNRMWRHNTGGGAGVFVLIEDSMILSVDLSPNDQIRIDTDDADFFGTIYNSKFWNYGSENANVSGITAMNWNIDPGDDILLGDANVDIATPGGLSVSDVSTLFQVDGRALTTFLDGAIESTMAEDGGQIGYRLPASAPDGPLPVTDGTPPAAVEVWMVY